MTIGALLRFELATMARGRTLTAVAAGFALASLVVALAGLSAGGVVTVQGFARTSVSLLQLVVWTVPMLALLTGAVAGADTHDVEFLVALPVSRPRLVVARWLAHVVALGGALLAGLGVAGLLLAALAGTADATRYLALVGVAVLLLGATLALGLWIGVAAGNRLRAVAGAALLGVLAVIVGLKIVRPTAIPDADGERVTEAAGPAASDKSSELALLVAEMRGLRRDHHPRLLRAEIDGDLLLVRHHLFHVVVAL